MLQKAVEALGDDRKLHLGGPNNPAISTFIMIIFPISHDNKDRYGVSSKTVQSFKIYPGKRCASAFKDSDDTIYHCSMGLNHHNKRHYYYHDHYVTPTGQCVKSWTDEHAYDHTKYEAQA